MLISRRRAVFPTLPDALVAIEKDTPSNSAVVLSTLVVALKEWCHSGSSIGAIVRLMQDRVLGHGVPATFRQPELKVRRFGDGVVVPCVTTQPGEGGGRFVHECGALVWGER